MRQVKKFFISLSFGLLIFSNFGLFSQNFRAVVKSPVPVDSLCWSEDETMFAYSEDSMVFIRNAKTYDVITTIPQKNTKSVKFSKEGYRDVLLTLSASGYFSIWDFINITNADDVVLLPKFSVACDNGNTVTAIAISNNSDYIAAAVNNNTFNLYYKLRLTKQTTHHVMSGHKANIYFLGFNSDSSYIVSASEDGVVKVWEPRTYKQVMSLDGVYTTSLVPVVFTNNNQIVCCDSATSIAVFDLFGNKLKSIDTGANIRNIKYLNEAGRIAVLTEDNRILLYQAPDYKLTGYLPAVSEYPVTDFEFNSDNSKILIGHKDGSIFKFDIEQIFLRPNQKPPKLTVVRKSQVSSGGGSEKYTNANTGAVSVFYDDNRMPSSLFFGASGALIPTSDLFSSYFSGGVEYRHTTLIPPFYFGVGMEGAVGVSVKDFPYTYKYAGNQVGSPSVLMHTFYVPAGFVFTPWNEDIFIIVSAKIGVKVMSIAIFTRGAYNVQKPHVSVYSSAGFGVLYKMFELDFTCDYDVINSFCPRVSVGYNLDINKFKK